MVWNYPKVSLEEMVKLTKGLVGIVILASGYQSSGRLCHWDSSNIKKAFLWASFFEHVLRDISGSDVYRDSIKELDANLHEMASDPSFPQGLVNLSCDMLLTAKKFVLEHLLHTLPLRDSHLAAFITAVVEMDIDKLCESENDGVSAYMNKLMLQNLQFDSVPKRRGILQDSVVGSEEITPSIEDGDVDLTKLTLQELAKRQSRVSCITTVEMGLNFLANAIESGSGTGPDAGLCNDQLNGDSRTLTGWMDCCVNLATFNQWKLRTVSYFLDNRTVRLVSGASMIFSAPKVQWSQVFEQLQSSLDDKDDILHETMELLLLGCVANRWNHVIEIFMSASYHSFTISKMYDEVCNLHGGSQRFQYKMEKAELKENEIHDYLAGLVGCQPHLLWKSSPALAAVAIPCWSFLFRLYLSEIETQLKGDSSTLRCCNCIVEKKEHIDCPSRVIGSWTRGKLAMKIFSQQCRKRIQFLNLVKKIASTGSAGTSVCVRRQVSSGCCNGSNVLRQLLFKFRSQWKQALRWQRPPIRPYSYDIQSYALNFDDGMCHDQHSSNTYQ